MLGFYLAGKAIREGHRIRGHSRWEVEVGAKGKGLGEARRCCGRAATGCDVVGDGVKLGDASVFGVGMLLQAAEMCVCKK
jgi:hypothetical protein